MVTTDSGKLQAEARTYAISPISILLFNYELVDV